MSGSVHIGTQGWNYDAWVGPFYPAHTRAADFLTVYARAFDTVEVDSTFYGMPSARTVRGWADRTPPQFRFALKMPQEVTHERRLRDCASLSAEFFDRARELGDKLAAILLQFGPDFAPTELPALAEFLPTLPRDIKFAVEFRQRGWIYDGVLALLSEHDVSLALTDGRWIPRKQVFALAERSTADLMYLRWMGNREIVDFSRVQVDRTRELDAWADVVARLERDGRTIFGYFNNHFSGHSPASARDLQRLLHQSPIEPGQLGEQMSLF
jgi:uncharacterized protein YecE (DUF72 family)